MSALALGCRGGGDGAAAPASMDAEALGEEDAKAEAPGAAEEPLARDGESRDETADEKTEEALGEVAPGATPLKRKSRGLGGRGKRVAKVRQSAGDVKLEGGGLDADAIKKVVGEHADEMSDCYASGLLTDPKLAGEVTLRLEIDGDGTVSSAKIPDADDLGASDVTDCLATAAADWSFPAPGDGQKITVSYPLKLSPDE